MLTKSEQKINRVGPVWIFNSIICLSYKNYFDRLEKNF
jgi:hypothetical protein